MKGCCLSEPVTPPIRKHVRPFLFLVLSALTLSSPATVPASPVTASLEAVLDAPVDPQGPAFTVYRWDKFPSILVLDTADFRVQDRMFSRLAFFLEKRGFRGRLLSTAALERMHGWNAHDYGPPGLAAFFNAAQITGVTLNPEEISLRDLALEEGVITFLRDAYAPGEGGVISISRSSSPIERRFLLTHESFHGVFFASPEYRAFSFELWDSLAPSVRRFFVRFLEELGYDADDRYLAVNEFQAYLMQQPIGFAPEYFERTVKRFAPGATVPVRGLSEAAARLNGFLQTQFGIHAGQTILPRPASGESG